MASITGWRRALGSSLLQSAGVYAAASILAAAMPFALIPILTRHLNQADYGRVALFQTAVNVVSLFTGLSVDLAVSRQFYDRDKKEMACFLGACLVLLALSTAALGLLILFLPGLAARMTQLSVEAVLAAVGVAASRFISNITLGLWQVRLRAFSYSCYQLLQAALNVSLTLWFVIRLGYGWRGLVLAQLIAGGVAAVMGIVVMIADFGLRVGWHWREMRLALGFGLPLIPHSLGGLAIGMTDRLAIANLVGVAEAGVYAVGAQIGMIVNVILGAFNTAWTPWVFSRLKRGSDADKQAITRATYLCFLGMAGLAVSVVAVSPLVFKWCIGQRFQGAIRYVPWVAAGYMFNGMYKLVCTHIFYSNKTYLLAVITGLIGIGNVCLTMIFVSRWGAMGAAVALACSFLLSFLLAWLAGSRLTKLPWRLNYPVVLAKN
ncbi:MAG TPA: oligosaccharide flippase family protein [Verrucomicrobiae bacterium]|nr:oligosaccharide flippase family protein [Verrucomicrobiae bacterium]